MPAASEQEEYRPLYIVELWLDSGRVVFSTRDVEISDEVRLGYGAQPYGVGPYGG